MWSPEWTQLYRNEKLQKKMLGTKINNDESELITKYNIKHKTPGIPYNFPFPPSLLLSSFLEETVRILENPLDTLKLFSETHA